MLREPDRQPDATRSSTPPSASSSRSRRTDGAAPSHLRDRLARPRLPLVPRHRGDRLDRHVVLLRRARQPSERAGARGRPGRRRRRRVVGDPRRRLLPDPQVPGRAAEAPEAAPLVQVGGLLDVAVRLRAPLHRLLHGRSAAADRPVGRRPRAVAGDPDLDPAARRRVARLRRASAGARRPAGRCFALAMLGLVTATAYGGRAALPAARGVHPGRRDARDDHGRERPLRDHPRPLGARSARRRRGASPTRSRGSSASSARCTTAT